MANDDQAPKRVGKGMIIGAWVLMLGLLMLFFANWERKQINPNQSVQSTVVDGSVTITLDRNRYGHYFVTGRINGEEAEFLLDTGATTVSIPAHLARLYQLKKGYAYQVKTANGIGTVYATQINEIRVGDIVVRNVRGALNPGMDGNEILLGMSFLRHLKFTQTGDTLTLQQ